MPWFDIIVLSMLLTSAGIGFYRGAAREMVTVVSFLFALIGSILALKVTGPIGRGMIEPDWAGTVAAGLSVMGLIYLALRLVLGGIANRIQETEILGMFDRTIGLGFGLVRALVLLGALNIGFTLATPADRVPKWLEGSTFYPLTKAAGVVLKTFAPKGMDLAGKYTPALSQAVRDGTEKAPRDFGDSRGYDAGERGGIDDLVEKSR